jgi:collagenase-like PrtC family protease
MFDLFGINKVSSREAIQEIMCGATRGLLEGFQWQLQEKDEKIRRLKEKLEDEKTWKERYDELSATIELKKSENKKS